MAELTPKKARIPSLFTSPMSLQTFPDKIRPIRDKRTFGEFYFELDERKFSYLENPQLLTILEYLHSQKDKKPLNSLLILHLIAELEDIDRDSLVYNLYLEKVDKKMKQKFSDPIDNITGPFKSTDLIDLWFAQIIKEKRRDEKLESKVLKSIDIDISTSSVRSRVTGNVKKDIVLGHSERFVGDVLAIIESNRILKRKGLQEQRRISIPFKPDDEAGILNPLQLVFIRLAVDPPSDFEGGCGHSCYFGFDFQSEELFRWDTNGDWPDEENQRNQYQAFWPFVVFENQCIELLSSKLKKKMELKVPYTPINYLGTCYTDGPISAMFYREEFNLLQALLPKYFASSTETPEEADRRIEKIVEGRRTRPESVFRIFFSKLLAVIVSKSYKEFWNDNAYEKTSDQYELEILFPKSNNRIITFIEPQDETDTEKTKPIFSRLLSTIERIKKFHRTEVEVITDENIQYIDETKELNSEEQSKKDEERIAEKLGRRSIVPNDLENILSMFEVQLNIEEEKIAELPEVTTTSTEIIRIKEEINDLTKKIRSVKIGEVRTTIETFENLYRENLRKERKKKIPDEKILRDLEEKERDYKTNLKTRDLYNERKSKRSQLEKQLKLLEIPFSESKLSDLFDAYGY